MKEVIQTGESKYIQQHLANERTYLAWIRTNITIIGVGFLITNLHFSTQSHKILIGDILAKVIGLASIFVGIISLIITTFSYFRKGKAINNQTFRFSRIMVIFLSTSLLFIFLIFGIYYVFIWGLVPSRNP
jgi:putative membrane protein